MDEYLSVKDVSKMLNVPKSTIYEWVRRSRFPQPQRFGKLLRWKKTVIEEAVNKSSVGVYQK